jgi:hypothetical protein
MTKAFVIPVKLFKPESRCLLYALRYQQSQNQGQHLAPQQKHFGMTKASVIPVKLFKLESRCLLYALRYQQSQTQGQHLDPQYKHLRMTGEYLEPKIYGNTWIPNKSV